MTTAACHSGAHALPLATDANRNRLPAWIREDFGRTRATYRYTLQAMADAGVPDAEGSILWIPGGGALRDTVGCSNATLFRHIAKLEAAGYLVCLGTDVTVGGFNRGNVYGIPGQAGALDHRARRRAMRIMVAAGELADGRPRYRPQTIEPGEQMELPLTNHTPSQHETAPVSKRDGPRLNMRRPPSQYETAPIEDGLAKQGSGLVWSGKKPDWCFSNGGEEKKAETAALPQINRAADLRNDGKTLELCREAARRGLVADSEAGRLRFFAAIEHAFWLVARDGKGKPESVLGHIVNRGEWRVLTQHDEDAAYERLKRLLHGSELPRAPPTPPRSRRPFSADAEVVAAARRAAIDCGHRGDVFEAFNAARPDWTRERAGNECLAAKDPEDEEHNRVVS